MNSINSTGSGFLDLLEEILEAAQDNGPFGDQLVQALGPRARQGGCSIAAALESLRRQRADPAPANRSAARPVTIRSADERYYRATVEVFLAADGYGEACDLISALLTENGVYGPDNMLRDWQYLAEPWEVTGVPPEATGREEYFGKGDDTPEAAPMFRHQTFGGSRSPVLPGA